MAYRSLRTNTSRQMMAFSDFPFPDTLPEFPGRADVRQYLDDYVHHFGFQDRIRLNTGVEKLSPTADGHWQVTTHQVDGTSLVETFDAVAVCSGLYQQPAIPHYPGVESYQGLASHSARYKGPEGFEDRNVLVVGVGSSGADIATEVSKVARQVELSTRRGVWFLPHTLGGRPYDHNLTRLSTLLPYRARMFFFRHLVLREYRRMGFDWKLLAPARTMPVFDVLRARPVPGSELLRCIAAGAVTVRPEVARLEPHQVVFVDGVPAPVDTIVYCTGYGPGFSFLDPSLIQVSGDSVVLYKHVFPSHLPNLAFISLCTVAGPLLPVAEIQSRWAARVFAGKVRLPPPAEMEATIRRQWAKQLRQGIHPMRVQLLDYMDEVARVIGVRPSLLRHPRLIPRLVAGPLTAAQYRLDGPGKL
ncbi:MAG: NAD(P)-binding domain-containing protein [Chloroflexi bacterium]|nr:NAD(P)-binding domain-containing protein [Chloroflexota bacterium]